MKEIYLDNAASSPMDPRVLEAMLPYMTTQEANPSSLHSPGLRAKEAVTSARKTIAGVLNCREDEVIFTSGGTESDNLAVVGITRAHSRNTQHAANGTRHVSRNTQHAASDARHVSRNTQHAASGVPHVITSAIEHPAVLEPLKHLQKTGAIELTILPVDKFGMVDPKAVTVAIRPDTVLISIMYANNEIGTIQPIADIGREILKWRKTNATQFPYFHSDACQAAGACMMDVEKLHVDAMSVNGSKIYGPKGAGFLYLRRGVQIEPLFRGGGQERSVRPGTENVPGIVGLATALSIAREEMKKENARLMILRDRLVEGLLAIPKTRLNGHPTERLPNNVNVSFLDIEGEAAVLYLDAEKIYVSTGSACASASLDPSHVILATGLSYEAAHGSLRFTLGRQTSEEDIDRVIAVMPGVMRKLRAMSPVNLDMKYFA